MKIKSKSLSGAIQLPQENFCSLSEITKDGYAVYLVRYQADLSKVIPNETWTVAIECSETPNLRGRSDVKSFSNKNSTQIVQTILQGAALQKELVRFESQAVFFAIKSDITAKIPKGKLKTKDFNISVKKLKGIKSQELSKKNISQPILQSSKVTERVLPTSLQQNYKSISFDLLVKNKRDPASIGDSNSLITNPDKVLLGSETPAFMPTNAIALKQNNLSFILLGDQTVGNQTQQSVSPSEYIQTIVIEQTSFIDIVEEIRVPISDIPDEFYLRLRLLDKQGVEQQFTEAVVFHKKNVTYSRIIKLTPGVNLKQTLTANILEIVQNDPNAIGVFVYKKELDVTNQISNDYVLLQSFPLRVDEGKKNIIDRQIGNKPVVYRVIPFNRENQKSSVFSSAVALSLKGHLKLRTGNGFCELNVKLLPAGIQLELGAVPSNVWNIQVCRKDLTNHEKQPKLLGQLSTKTVTKDSRLFFLDNFSLVQNRTYEYSLKFVYSDGSVVPSGVLANIQYRPVTNSIIETKLGPIRAVTNGTDLDVQFEIRSSIALGKNDLVKQALENQGLLGFFQNDLTLDRDKLQSLIAHQVYRTCLDTNEVEDFGVLVTTTFSDRNVGKIKAVKPIFSGKTYEYCVISYFLNTEVLLDSFEKTEVNAINPNKNYTWSPSKWLHPVTLVEGSLTTESSLKTNHADTNFSFGTVGAISYSRITLADEQAAVQDAFAHAAGLNQVLVEWKTKYPEKVDHFLVIREVMGMKSIIGKVCSQTEVFRYLDCFVKPSSVKEQEVSVTYTIFPVFQDYSLGTSSKTNELIVKVLQL